MESKSLQKIQNLFTEGLFMTALVLVTIMVFFVFAVRSQQGNDLGKFLPAQETRAVMLFNLEEYALSTSQPSPLLTDLFGEPLVELPWFKRKVGLAWLGTDLVRFIEVDDRAEAKAWLESFKVEGEEWLAPEINKQVTCYTYSQPDCFIFQDSFLVLSSSVEVLDSILTTKSTSRLSQDAHYRNIKGRLPLLADANIYINLKTSRQELVTFFSQLGIREPGYLESILRIFPACGMSIKMQPGVWTVESITLVDKDQLNGKAYAHPSLKYKHELLAFTSENFLLEWGGEDLWGQKNQILQLLEGLNPSAALTFKSSIENKKNQLFGDIPLEAMQGFLENEFYFAWTPQEDFLLLLETESPTQELQEGFLVNYRYPQRRVTETGEVLADILGLYGEEAQHEGQTYTRFMAGDELVVGTALVDKILLISSSEEELKASMDRIQGRQSRRSLSSIEGLLSGSDELWHFELQNLPEEHIIKTLLPGVESSTSTRKHFDDGFFTRHRLILSQ